MRMELETQSESTAGIRGLGRLCLLLATSTLCIAGAWHLMYGVGLLRAVAVVGEVAVLVTIAFVCAWRWAR
jgi:hypothetical protein